MIRIYLLGTQLLHSVNISMNNKSESVHVNDNDSKNTASFYVFMY